MPQPVASTTVASLALALDASSRRHEAIATNIANANTEGYVPVRLSFEAAMAQARAGASGAAADAWDSFSAGGDAQPVIGGGAVQLDAEVAQLSQNAVHFQALVRGLSRHFSILSSAVSDGKK